MTFRRKSGDTFQGLGTPGPAGRVPSRLILLAIAASEALAPGFPSATFPEILAGGLRIPVGGRQHGYRSAPAWPGHAGLGA